jgi:hypothetical protein
MGIDPMNKISIIIRILFAVTLFQHIIGDTVLLWDKGKEKSCRHGKFDSLWLGPYMIREIADHNSFTSAIWIVSP